MIDIKIDISDAVSLFNLSKQEIDSLKELTVMNFVNEAYNNIVELATKRLNSTRNAYIQALQIRKEDQFTYSLILGGSAIATMVEMGAASFDMKPFFQNSPKVKLTKKGGWYLIIPFAYRTTAANPTSGNAGQLLPRHIYDLIRNSPDVVKPQVGNTVVSLLQNKSIPKRYQPQSVITELKNRASDYIPKSSIYAGLQRVQNVDTGKSTYNTFRVVSSNSDPKSWIHPGIQAYSLMDEGLEITDRDESVNKAIEQLFDNM